MNLLRYKRKSKRKYIQKRFFLIVIFFIMSVFAWLAYVKNLNVDFKLHINSWNIKYYSGDGDDKTEISVRPYNMSYDSIYPGMLDQINKITVENNSEVDVNLEYVFDNLKIMNQDYEIVESVDDASTEYYVIKEAEVVSGKYITQKLISSSDDIPFELSIVFPNEIGRKSSSLITIILKWDGTNDSLDNIWGRKISIYARDHVDDGSTINFSLNINTYQIVTDDNENVINNTVTNNTVANNTVTL